MNTICRYGVPIQKHVEPKPPQETTQDIKHTSHALLRLYGFALDGTKPEHHDEILEHFRTIGKALGVM
jgi:hypothetical protein